MAKSAQRLEARRLRRCGFSINEIAKSVGFSKRTVSRWCNNIVLDKSQKQNLWLRAKAKHKENFRKYCESRHEATQEKIQTLKQEGIKAIGDLSKRDLFIAGVALYWAEGFKKDMRFGFANRSEFIRSLLRLVSHQPVLIEQAATFPFVVPKERSVNKIIAGFSKTKKYSAAFLRDLEAGLKQSDYFKA